MKKGVEKLAEQLLATINTTEELKKVSMTLETLSNSASIKSKAKEIATNSQYSDSLKAKKLMELFSDIDMPVLLEFFRKIFSASEFWLFSSKQFDYFDQLVQSFQLITESVIVINIIVAIELKQEEILEIAKDLSESLDKQVIISIKINPAIMGGAQVRIGNLAFDYTLRSKFSQFQRQWLSRMARTSAMVGE
jgi:F0F1-type ATP synthase delta subunit